MSKEIEQDITKHYQIITFMGSGAYGHVWKVKDKENGSLLALKKIFDAFQNDVDAQRTYREVSILHQLDHQNIIKLKGVIKAKNGKDLYMLFDFMEADLHSVIIQGILTIPHQRYIVYQLCRSLKYLHSAQLVHRDLKPSNILINSNCQIKICDFGLTRTLIRQQQSELILSQDVATRWYRSPQMLLSSQNYDISTDLWSLGCIIAQILRGQPIFPGSSTTQQMTKILQFTGKPKKDVYQKIGVPIAEAIINQIPIKKLNVESYFDDTCDEALKKIALMLLKFNPYQRPSVQQLIQFQCFAQFRSKGSQVKCCKFIASQLDDNVRLNAEVYKKAIYKDIQRRYPHLNYIQVHKNYRLSNSHIQGVSTQLIRRFISNSLTKPKQSQLQIIKRGQRILHNKINTYIRSLHKSNEKINYYSYHSGIDQPQKKLQKADQRNRIYKKFASKENTKENTSALNTSDQPFEEKVNNKIFKRKLKGKIWINKVDFE